MSKKKVILVIRDGWGYRESCADNAICESPTPITDNLMKTYPNTLIDASGEAVGLPAGYQGNSEVGHMTIGSGRIILQSLPRINKSIESKEFFKIPEFLSAIDNCKEHNSALHLIGLLQSAGVHSHEDHLYALLELCKQENFDNVLIHLITDGRDAPIHESLDHVKSLQEKMSELGIGKIATICGRYYAMDRDQRWDRTKKAYDCVIEGKCVEKFDDVVNQIKTCHNVENNKESDEFIIPRCASFYEGVNDNDSFIFFNFRTDRTRQLTKAIVESDFEGFLRDQKQVFYVAMTQFYNPMKAYVAFKDQDFSNLLGNVVSDNNLKQLRISETEKYAHVTFFFNGQVEEPNKGEDRELIHSPKVATYDLKPEMSVYEIKDKLIECINKDEYDLIVTNLVNGDMVGHTGIVPAIDSAVEHVDKCLGEIVNAGLAKDYTLIVFADHGNAEDQTPKWRTSHTTNPVPCILISNDEELKSVKLKEGMGLKDIAPTALKLLDLPKPSEMSGNSLF
jgi:2,3-bisphosphoglycerate-independent phosphoglycerate mutase